MKILTIGKQRFNQIADGEKITCDQTVCIVIEEGGKAKLLDSSGRVVGRREAPFQKYLTKCRKNLSDNWYMIDTSRHLTNK